MVKKTEKNVLYYVSSWLYAVFVCLKYAAVDNVFWSICSVMYDSVYLNNTCPCMVLLF